MGITYHSTLGQQKRNLMYKANQRPTIKDQYNTLSIGRSPLEGNSGERGGLYPRPVWPKPPSPRSVSDSLSTSSHSMTSCRAMTI